MDTWAGGRWPRRGAGAPRSPLAGVGGLTRARGGRRLAGDVVFPGAVPAAPHPDAAGRLPGRGPAWSRKRSSAPAERRPSPSALRTARAPLGPRLSAASRGSRGGQRQLPAPRLSREPLRDAAVSRAAPAGHREARPRAAGAVQAGREGAAAGGWWGAGPSASACRESAGAWCGAALRADPDSAECDSWVWGLEPAAGSGL